MRKIFRKTQIRTRLLIAFLVISFFTMYTGLMGVKSLTNIGDSAVLCINTVAILNDMYDYNINADNSIYYLLRFEDPLIKEHLYQEMADRTAKLKRFMDEYVKAQVRFSHIFSPGDMQNMNNIALIYNETYTPILNEILELHKNGNTEKAIYVYENRLDPIYCLIFYSVSSAFDRVFQSTKGEIANNNRSARISATFMSFLVLGSLIASVILALMVTKSISAPLTDVKQTAEKMAVGNLDNIRFEESEGRDEIAHLSSSLNKTVRQLKQVQQLKMEAIEIRMEKEKAEGVSQAKTQFLARMSHEIRTPMNAIIGMAELAMRENIPGAARGHVKTIKQAGTSLLTIINDILDISKIESGKFEIVKGDYEFSSMIGEVISIIRIKALDTPLKFVVNLDPGINNELYGDELRVRQVLLNILSNAVKYTDRGQITLSARCEPSPHSDTVNLVMDVADTGRGIKEEDLKKLFSDFVQVDAESNKGIEGTGLGLAITKSLVTAMNGNVSVKSEYGRGSTFTVVIPQQIRSDRKIPLMDAEMSGNFEAEEEAVIKFTAPDAKILVVDDVGTNLKVAEGLLSPYGVRVKTCKDGAAAVEMARGEKFDMILMDHMMPGMGGIEAAKRIRETENGLSQNAPIVALTANAVAGVREMFLQHGFNDFLAKPVEIVKLNSALERWIPKDKQKALTEEAAVSSTISPSTFAVDNIAIPGVDAAKGVAMMGGNPDNYFQALEIFCKDGADKTGEIPAALENGNMQLYITYTHALKSAAANIGAEAVSIMAKDLEAAGLAGDRAFIDGNNGKLLADLKALVEGINNCLDATYRKSRQTVDIDTGTMKIELAKLKAAIDDVDVDAISAAVKTLQQFSGNTVIDDILRNALTGEYDGAVGLIDNF